MGIPDPQLDFGGHRAGAGRGPGVQNDSNFLTTPSPGPLTRRGCYATSTRRVAATSSPVTKGGQPLGRRADPKESQRISEREKWEHVPHPNSLMAGEVSQATPTSSLVSSHTTHPSPPCSPAPAALASWLVFCVTPHSPCPARPAHPQASAPKSCHLASSWVTFAPEMGQGWGKDVC